MTKCAFIGEAFGEAEARFETPFIGCSITVNPESLKEGDATKIEEQLFQVWNNLPRPVNMKIFKDKNNVPIKVGDTLRIEYTAKFRERPNQKRVAQNMMNQEVIVPDEGQLLPNEEEHWVDFQVKWSGACMVIEYLDCSDSYTLSTAEKFGKDRKRMYISQGFSYMNSVFKSKLYEVR